MIEGLEHGNATDKNAFHAARNLEEASADQQRLVDSVTEGLERGKATIKNAFHAARNFESSMDQHRIGKKISWKVEYMARPPSRTLYLQSRRTVKPAWTSIKS